MRTKRSFPSNPRNADMKTPVENWKADVLMVDDDAGNLLALEGLLEPLGQNLLRAHSGENALSLLLKHDPAVILLDVQMPGMDGFETARLIRLRDRSRLTPIIFLTGMSMETESAFRGYEVGAVDYLMKPLAPEVLRAKVSVFVELHRTNVALNREIAERAVVEVQLRNSQTQLRALAARIIAVREEERIRIAGEIQDELGQVLGGLKADLTWLARQLAGTGQAFEEKVEAMGLLVDATVHLIRRIATGLRPEILDDMDLLAAFGRQAEEFEQRMGIPCRLDLPKAMVVLEKNLSMAVFRIFQEMLTNVVRHANAHSVDVTLRVSDDLVDLKVVDDGIGIGESRIHGRESLGLLGMQERARLFGGMFNIEGGTGKGTTACLSIPMSPSI